MKLNTYIDHTLLKPTATPEDIKNLCSEAKTYNFYAVCVNGSYVKLAKKELSGNTVKIAAVIGFPLGAMSTITKIFEAKQCIADGADEIDMVLNIGLLKAKKYDAVEDDIASVKQAIGTKILKVIFENALLSNKEKKVACKLAINAQADFIKTSTGFSTGGATFEDVILMKKEAKDNIKIKASGGIKDRQTAEKYIALGVSRIGTSSGIQIVLNK